MLDKKNSTTDFAQQIKEGLDEVLATDPSTLIMGLGVTDPKGVFGTTLGLSEKYGPNRVIETPTSENAITGIGVGLAITGYRPIMVHQRLDFFLLAMDQLVNSAAKWHYMFGGQQSVPITIRLITGRGWGQGPTHSQNLHSWFTHIPGLKVVTAGSRNGGAKNGPRLIARSPRGLIRTLRKQHRLILIDGGIWSEESGSLGLARECDGICLLVPASKSGSATVEEILGRIEDSGSRLAGVLVLPNQDRSRSLKKAA